MKKPIETPKLSATLIQLYEAMVTLPKGKLAELLRELEEARESSERGSPLRNVSYRTLIDLVADMKTEKP